MVAIVALAQWVRLQVVLNAVTISSKVDSSVTTVDKLDARGCTIDAGYQCAGAPSVCVPSNPVCGNGVNEIGESCDDGNNKNGDGCSNKCTI
jgi:cysteine-rich repeat protein